VAARILSHVKVRLELPTWFLVFVVYAGWLAVTWLSRELPPIALAPAGAFFLALHGSLQHEAVHGHPTRRPWLNALVCGVPLSLWLPFSIYRSTHLAHHRSDLTDPLDDPESFYSSAPRWHRMGKLSRGLAWIMTTLAGRLVLGPWIVLARFFAVELRRQPLTTWLVHAVACAPVLAWIVFVCEMAPWTYALTFVYPGLSLTLLRSFAEHRPHPVRAHRTAVVETNPLFALLFLNNNLHALHHHLPGVPWYELPGHYRAMRERLLAENGGYLLRGYRELARFAIAPKDSPLHPSAKELA
jgi:fatty acid desaturase